VIGWLITGIGMLMVAFVYQSLATRKPEPKGLVRTLAALPCAPGRRMVGLRELASGEFRLRPSTAAVAAEPVMRALRWRDVRRPSWSAWTGNTLMLKVIRTTIIGGIIFLIPIAIFVAVIGKGLEITGAIAKPIAHGLPVNMIGGLAAAQGLAILLLVLICFLAGLLARAAIARRVVDGLEVNVLSRVPAYALLKTKTQSMLSPEDVEGMSPAVVRFDDSWQIAFEIERIAGGKVTLFLPGSPDPWSGSFCMVDEDRVTPLDLSVPAVAAMSKRLGKGASEALRDHLRASERAA
jgi:uncharacterized membrane protein